VVNAEAAAAAEAIKRFLNKKGSGTGQLGAIDLVSQEEALKWSWASDAYRFASVFIDDLISS